MLGRLSGRAYGVRREAVKVASAEARDWQWSVDVMQSGVFYCSQVAGRQFLQQREGTIINISSIRGFSSNPGRIAYCASKAALLRMERMCVPDDIGRVTICIASDEDT